MAYRGGVGYWIVIIFLALFMAIFAALYFTGQEKIKDAEAKVSQASVDELVKDDNESVKQLILQARDLTQKIDGNPDDPDDHGLMGQIDDLKQQIDVLKKEKNAIELAKNEVEQKVKRLEEEINQLRTSIADEQAHSQKIKADRNADHEATVAKLKSHIERQNGELEQRRQEIKRLQERVEAVVKAGHEQIMNQQSEIQTLKENINNITQARRENQAQFEEDHDGKIIQADIDNKFVVINLGSNHRVYRGMRFDVIRWRLNKWDYMGAIQINEVNKTTSTAVILDEVVQKKICPETLWEAPNIHMLYSPWVTSGSDNKAVPLVKTETIEKSSMRKMDPIVVGDFITHPFYSRDKVLKFVIVGEPVNVSIEEVKQRIKQNGGIIQDNIAVDSDYLVLGRIRKESDVLDNEEAKKIRDKALSQKAEAEKLGVPIIRIVNMNRFLQK